MPQPISRCSWRKRTARSPPRAKRRRQQERLLKDQLAAAEDRARPRRARSADDEYALKLREKDKQLADAWQKVKEAEAKMQQGSQQTQGEALELEIEELLRDAFRDDEISEVKKGQRGADITEKVIDRRGRNCGTILWETKNGKWQEAWLAKLRDDQREAKAHIAVLVAPNRRPTSRPSSIATAYGSSSAATPATLLPCLRHILIAVYAERANQAGKDEKMEILYGYLTSLEFQHRVQAIVEGFTYLLNDVERRNAGSRQMGAAGKGDPQDHRQHPRHVRRPAGGHRPLATDHCRPRNAGGDRITAARW